MNHQRIKLNETAYFDTYLLHASQEYNVGKRKPLVIIAPGGAYAFTSDREAEPIALKFNSVGFHSIVLWYTTKDKVKHVPQNALIEFAMTIKYAREHADEWLIDKDNIIVCGFSAGGHLALSMSTKWNQPWLHELLKTDKETLKVNLAIAAYPACVASIYDESDIGVMASLIESPNTANERFFGTKNPTQKDVDEFNILTWINEDTPPMFIWHTFEDILVDVNHSLLLGSKLRENNIPFEMHIFQRGEHGLALADRTTARKPSHHNKHVATWFDLCESWLSSYVDK